VVTIETIGFGDITPKTPGARVFTCFYAALGILNLGVAVSLTRETVLEAMEVGYRKRVKVMKDRRRETRKKRMIDRRWRAAVEWRLRDKGEQVWVRDERKKDRGVVRKVLEFVRWHSPVLHPEHGHHHGMHLNLDGLSPSQLESAALETGVPLQDLLPTDFIIKTIKDVKERKSVDGNHGQDDRKVLENLCKGLEEPAANTLTHARLGRMIAMLSHFAFAMHGSSARDAGMVIHHVHDHEDDTSHHSDHMHAATEVAPPGQGPSKDVAQSYESFRAGMEREERKAFYARLIVACSIFVLFWVVSDRSVNAAMAL
jgi:potassium channel subfamily K